MWIFIFTKELDTESTVLKKGAMTIIIPKRSLPTKTSLVVQGLRLQAPNAGAQVGSLVKELDPTGSN